MAESGGGQQRSFTKNLSRQSAQQIRQSATATVKALSEQRNRPKLRVVDPVDYEGELSSRRRELEKEAHLSLLLFPQRDISVAPEEWKRRTHVSSVPDDALHEKTTLFTQECLKFYTSSWHRVDYNYSKFATSFNKVINPEYRQGLPTQTFELDLIEEERLASMSSSDFVDGVTPLKRKGYLNKGPFPSDGGISMSLKNYKKKWFVLVGSPSDGGYYLNFYKDEKSTSLKGKIPLDTCTEIKRNTRHKFYGFDLLTDDDKVFYPLAADTESEMEEWTSILTRAIGLEMEGTDSVPASPSSFYQQDTLLKDTTRTEMRPDLLERTSETDAAAARSREGDRHSLFHVYPELMRTSAAVDDHKPHAPLPEEKLGFRFLVQCRNLRLRLTTDRGGVVRHLEPFFLRLALFDAQSGRRISEDFHVDLNDPALRKMTPPPQGFMKAGPHPLSQSATSATEGTFSVTFPHPEVYLVVRVEKVLQGGITACAEPYMKSGDNIKVVQKLSQQTRAVCGRLGHYHMPFAWAVRPLFTSTEELDPTAEFSPLYKQEREKLTDEDVLKVLSDFKSLHKQKLQVIPGALDIDVLPLQEDTERCTLTHSLLPVKSSADSSPSLSASPRPTPPVREIREFFSDGSHHLLPHYHPHLSLTHHLYVYPLTLKYDAQKAFAKARNIACCVQFKDSDERDAAPIAVIYSKVADNKVFTDRANTAVLHHYSTPSFYEEVKMKLPILLKSSHHLLFTFYHIGCDVQKVTKASTKASVKHSPVETIVGYAWLPLLDSDGRVTGDTHALPVCATLPPGYLSIREGGTLGHASSPHDHVKWVDGHKSIFRVSMRLDSTIYTQDTELNGFFAVCQSLSSPAMEAKLKQAIQSLSELGLAPTIRFLPVILSQVFHLLSSSQKEVEPFKMDVFVLLLQLVDKIAEADRTELLRTYIEYIFVTEVDSSRKRGVHDELARVLVLFLRQQKLDLVPKLLDHLWFFLEVMLKSMAQYLTITKKTASSRKTRYPEDFGWNLQSFVTILLSHIRERHTDLTAKRANRSLADFVKRSFSFMDRGVVFKIVTRYLEAFSVRENVVQLSNLKLEFLRIVCDHEHFVPLNLPFPQKPEHLDYRLTDEFCRKHFLIGVLLREVESSLDYDAGPVRRNTIRILRNVLAKHDCDPRYADAGQKARIAALYFPLIPLVMEHLIRLDTGSALYISPMLNTTSMATFNSQTRPPVGKTFSSTPQGTLEKDRDDRRSLDRYAGSDLASAVASHRGSQSRTGTLSTAGAPTLPRIDDESVFTDPEASLTSDTIAIAASPLDQTIMDLNKLSVEETRDLMISVLFVLKYLDDSVLLHWWRECIGPSSGVQRWSTYEDNFSGQFSQLLDFFDLLESCLYTFKYSGRRAIAVKISTQASMLREAQSAAMATKETPPQGTKDREKSKRHTTTASLSGAPPTKMKGLSRNSSASGVSTAGSSISPPLPPTSTEEVDLNTKVEGALSNEAGLTILTLLDTFATNFVDELTAEDGDNIIMVKYFTLLVTFLQVNHSVTLQTHIFAALRGFLHKFTTTLFRGSPEYCGILCYEILHSCNSRLAATRTEAIPMLYLLMRCNFEYFTRRGFVRTTLQSTIAVSKLVSTLLKQSDSNLKRSLAAVAAYASQDERVQGTAFPGEVRDLMKKLKTVLSSTAQMKAHQNDPEKLVDLHYSLAKSYGNSPELRQTWLDSIAALHLKYGNYAEAAQCCIHIAGLMAEYLWIRGTFPAGCSSFKGVSPNVQMEESGIQKDQETSEEQRLTERNLLSLLETSIKYLNQAELYETMSEVYKLLQPFYEKNRDFKHMMEMYSTLHGAYTKVVEIMSTGRRYLATYFRVAFYGRPFGDDHEKQYIYKEPKVTTLGELTLRLQRLYSRKFGTSEIVHIIKESGKVNPSSLDLDHAHIQITHVEPFFSAKELEERRTKFERGNRISRFVFETPYTKDGRTHGDVTKHCMRKTILTTSHWFPYVKKRIVVIDQVHFEMTPIEVALEAMEKKTADMSAVVMMDPPDLKRLQLLLQGSISAQVNQGVQEYCVFLREPLASSLPTKDTDRLKEVYRQFIYVCRDALELNGRLISMDQLLYQDELRSKFEEMVDSLSSVITLEEDRSRKSPSPTEVFPQPFRVASHVDPHRMSAILFHSISGNK